MTPSPPIHLNPHSVSDIYNNGNYQQFTYSYCATEQHRQNLATRISYSNSAQSYNHQKPGVISDVDERIGRQPENFALPSQPRLLDPRLDPTRRKKTFIDQSLKPAVRLDPRLDPSRRRKSSIIVTHPLIPARLLDPRLDPNRKKKSASPVEPRLEPSLQIRGISSLLQQTGIKSFRTI